MPARASSLSSSDIFFLITTDVCYLWFGKVPVSHHWEGGARSEMGPFHRDADLKASAVGAVGDPAELGEVP